MTRPTIDRLRIGFVGSGFIAHFHLQSLLSVRNVEVTGVYSRSAEKRSAFVARVDELGLGACRAHDSLASLCDDDDVDALWIVAPNYTRLETMRTVHRLVKIGRAHV